MDNNQFMADGTVTVQADCNQAKLYNRPHSITADVVMPNGGAEGILITQGSPNAMWQN